LISCFEGFQSASRSRSNSARANQGYGVAAFDMPDFPGSGA
jgi:hypothetical protein